MSLELTRPDLVPPTLRPAADLLAEGRALAREERLGSNLFLREAGVASEAEYKRRKTAAGQVMQHAHIGFRSVERTCAAMAEVYRACLKCGVTVDRFGITQPRSGQSGHVARELCSTARKTSDVSLMLRLPLRISGTS